MQSYHDPTVKSFALPYFGSSPRIDLLNQGEAFLNETSPIPTNSLYRHPCTEKPPVVADFGLYLQEGMQDLKLEHCSRP